MYRLAIFTDLTRKADINAIDAYKIYAHIKIGDIKSLDA
jgi:hypothetical protein